MNKSVRAFIFWAVIVVSAVLLWQVVRAGNAQAEPEISYSRFLAQVADGQVSKVVILGSAVRGRDAKGNVFRVVAPANQTSMLEALQLHSVEIWFKDVSATSWLYWILNCGPIFVLTILCIVLARQAQTTNRLLASGSIPAGSTPSQPRVGP